MLAQNPTDPHILSVGLTEPYPDGQADGFTFMKADGAQEALELLTIARFALLLIGTELPDMELFDLIRRIRHVRPRQKLAIVSTTLSEAEERHCRQHGVASVFDTMPTNSQLRELLRIPHWPGVPRDSADRLEVRSPDIGGPAPPSCVFGPARQLLVQRRLALHLNSDFKLRLSGPPSEARPGRESEATYGPSG